MFKPATRSTHIPSCWVTFAPRASSIATAVDFFNGRRRIERSAFVSDTSPR